MNYKIKHFLKKSSLFSFLGYKYREYRTHAQMKEYLLQPVQNNKIMLASGRYGDSLSRISEYLHRFHPDISIVWAYRNEDLNYLSEFPDYIKTVLFESNEYYKELSTSSVWVFNVLVSQGVIKRKNQLYIQVWHGDKPFKRIGNDAAEKSSYRRHSAGRKFSEQELCDFFVTGSIMFIDIWEKSMGYSGPTITTGLPRNDDFFDSEINCETIKQEIGITGKQKLLIYAPTFRDHITDNGRIGTDIDICRILDALETKYQCDWLCLKRSHGGTHLTLDKTKEDSRIVDVSRYRDMTNLMLISDILITDYSSCAGDFAYTGRPVLLYQDDYEVYTSKDRSLIFDMAKTPFYIATNMEEMVKLIENLDLEAAKQNDDEILRLYQSSQTCHSTVDVCEIIISHMKKISEEV